MLFLFVFHIGNKPRKNANKEAKFSQGSWRVGARTVSARCSGRILHCSEINACYNGYTLDKKKEEKVVFSRSLQRRNTGLTVLRAKTLTLKDKKDPLLRERRLGLILRRDKQQKYPCPWRFSPRLKGKRPKFQVSLRFSAVLVLVSAFLGFVFSAIFLVCSHGFS